MSVAFTYRQKLDVICCGDKTGFPRPGHMYICAVSIGEQSTGVLLVEGL